MSMISDVNEKETKGSVKMFFTVAIFFFFFFKSNLKIHFVNASNVRVTTNAGILNLQNFF